MSPTCRNSRRLPGGDQVASNQVLYNVSRRGIEFDLLPSARERGLNVMAYTPIEQGRILGHATLRESQAPPRDAGADRAGMGDPQDGVVAIPRAGSPEHVRENAAALQIELAPRDLQDIDGLSRHRAGRERSK